MRDIVLDEEGNVYEAYAERNNTIKTNLQATLERFMEEKNEAKLLKRSIPRMGYRFSKQLFCELSKHPPMTVARFSTLRYEDLNTIWTGYLELTAYYNQFFEIVDNKQLFCLYAGINTRQFGQLENSEDDDIRDFMNSINATFVGLGFIASESGEANATGVNQRLRAGGEAGHSVMTATEERVIEKASGMTNTEFESRLALSGIKIAIDKP